MSSRLRIHPLCAVSVDPGGDAGLSELPHQAGDWHDGWGSERVAVCNPIHLEQSGACAAAPACRWSSF
jgi:hypothetical protein